MNDPAVSPVARVETELKLLAPGGLGTTELMAVARTAGFTCDPTHVRRHRDRYLDTDGLRLATAGLGLRVRVRDGHAELGLKLRAQPRGRGARAALWRRVELEVPLARGAAPPADAAALPESMRHRVAPWTLAHPLHEVVVLATERTSIPIRDADGAAIEMTLDHVEVEGGGAAARFAEVEAELVSGSEEALERLARALAGLGLVPSAEDKLARALARRGVDVPALPSTRLFSEMSAREAASRVLQRHLVAMRRAEAEARIGEDAEGVHQMRVATRRLRATLRLFADALPARAVEAQRRFLRRTAALLGDVRDLDVMLESLPVRVAAIPAALREDARAIEALLRAKRERARARLLVWLESPARFAGEDRLERFVLDPGRGTVARGHAARSIGEAAKQLLAAEAARTFRRGERIGKQASIEGLHELRLAVKRLRYAAEALRDVLDPEVDAALERMVALQDELGALNDATIASERILEWSAGPDGRRLSRRTLLAAGALVAQCEAVSDDVRRDARSAWKRFAKGRVRRALGLDPARASDDEEGDPARRA